MKTGLASALCLLLATVPTLAATPAQRLAEVDARLAELEQRQHRRSHVTVSGFLRFASETQTRVHDSAGNSLSFRDALAADDWNNRRLSRAGIQFNARLEDRTEAVLQLIGAGSEDYNVDAQWAFIGYHLTPDLQVRAGRIVLPLYLHSQYLNAGYTHPWIEMPTEVYGAVRAQTFEGLDLSWNLNQGMANHRLNLFWGNYQVQSPVAPGVELDYRVRNQHGINLRSRYGDLTTWLAFTASQGTLDLAPVGAGAYSLDGAYTHYLTAGAQYDAGRWLLMTEVTELKLSAPQHWFPTQPAGYVLAGYRIGNLMPHLTWAFADSVGRVTDPGAEALYRRFAIRQKSWTLGLRYDISNGLALKAEASRYYDFSNQGLVTRGAFEGPEDPVNCPAAGICAPAGQRPLVFRLALDAVF